MERQTLLLLTIVGLCLAGCSSPGQAEASPDASCAEPQADSSSNVVSDATADTSADAATAPDAGLATMGLRVANMRNDDQPLDFCVAPMSGSYTTPYLKNASVPTLPSGLASRHVSAYAALRADTYKVVLVPGPATDCSGTPLGQELTNLKVAAAGDFTTVVLMGGGTFDGGAAIPLKAAAFADEHGSTAEVHARVLNASPYLPSPVLKLETQSGSRPLYAATPYGQVPSGMSGTVTPRGFFDADPNVFPAFQREALAFDLGMPPIRISVGPLHAGDVASFFLLGPTRDVLDLNNARMDAIGCADVGAFSVREGFTQTPGETTCEYFY